MSCGCITANNAENKEMREVEALAKRYAADSGVWVACFQLPCGAWDFCEEKDFNENGKTNIQHFAPV
jgi:hypothetical protein